MGATPFEISEQGRWITRCEKKEATVRSLTASSRLELPAPFILPGAPGLTRQALRESCRRDSQLAKNSLPVVPFDFLVD